MSLVTCPCGFRAEGPFREANAAYAEHGCEHHASVPPLETSTKDNGLSWPDALVFIVAILAVAFICAGGWEVFR